MNETLSIVIPAFNDEKTISLVIEEANAIAREFTGDYEIVVVNDGSSDNTYEKIKQSISKHDRVRMISHNENEGYGRTIKELYRSAEKDLVFSCPGDGQIPPAQLLKMITGISECDLIVGYRKKRKDGLKRKIQTAIYNFLIRTIYGVRIYDVNSVKLFRRSILKDLNLDSESPFVDAELCIKAHRAGIKMREIEIEHLPRQFKGNNGGKTSIVVETFTDLLNFRKTI